jgi:hypothetical protein
MMLGLCPACALFVYHILPDRVGGFVQVLFEHSDDLFVPGLAVNDRYGFRFESSLN